MHYRCLVLIWCGQFILSTASPMTFHSSEQYYHTSIEFETEQLKQRILSGLGLSSIPNASRANHTMLELEKMMEVYRRSINEDEEGGGEEWTSGTVGDTVKRFYSFKDNATKTGLVDNFHLDFPVNIGDEEDDTRGILLHSAKLYLYKRNREPTYEGWFRTINNVKTAKVKLYQLMEPQRKEDSNKLLIEVRNVVFGADGWEMFDVTKTVATWIEKPLLNYGFQLECEDCEYQKLVLVAADTITDEMKNRARLDIWIAESSSRSKRSRNLSNRYQSPILDCTQGQKSDLCCRYSMWVSFSDIGWEWILQPNGFQAYFCKGKCPHDYNNYASTHALIQSIFNFHRNEEIPAPCCVPKRLKSLSLLHYNDKDPPELVVTRQSGMIAQECACS